MLLFGSKHSSNYNAATLKYQNVFYDTGIFAKAQSKKKFCLGNGNREFLGLTLSALFTWYKISIAPEADMKPRRLCLFLL